MSVKAWFPLTCARTVATVATLATVLTVRAVDIAVDATTVLRTIDDRMFGVNTAVWDGAFKSAQTLPLLKAAEIRTLRFPGGSTSDTYDWKTNRSYVSGTRTTLDWTWGNSFDDFAQVALALKAEVFITANYGSGTPDQAAEWVKYSNLTKQYGFKYWEIGNENYGAWEEDIHAAKWDPVTYATEAKAFIEKMKAVDSTIKVGVVVQTGEDQLDSKSPVHEVTNPRTGVKHHGWTPVMLATLKSLGVTPDYVIYHRYPLAPGSETDAKLLSGTSISNTTWADDAADLRRQVNDYLGANGTNVELVVTENNDVYTEPGKQSTSLVDGLFLADSFGQLLQTEFRAWVWWALHNGSPRDSAGNLLGNFSSTLYGWRTYGDYGMISMTDDPHPTYYTMKLLSRFARGGDSVVKATSGNALLSAYAVKRQDGRLALLVINKDSKTTLEGNFTLTGFAPGGAADVFSYGIPQDEAARTGTGSKDIAATTLSGLGASFKISFAPYSATVVTLQPMTPSAPTQVAAFASGANEVTLTWQPPASNAAGVSAYTVTRARDNAFTQDVVTVTLGAVTSHIDQGLSSGTTYYYRLGATNASGASPSGDAVTVTTLPPAAQNSARLLNISARAYCGAGNSVTIGGFVVRGGDKRVLIRAVGPSLARFNLDPATLLSDPTVELHDSSRPNDVIGTNDDWSQAANLPDVTTASSQVGASALDPQDARSSAMLPGLPSGVYSFVVRGKSGGTGIVLLEAYDAGGTGRLMNIATRADGRTGNEVAIGGFVIGGEGVKRVLIRAVGPTLTQYGLSGAEVMSDPFIELHGRANAVIATNDNWKELGNVADVVATGSRIGATAIDASDAKSAALLISLPAGVYSFVGRGQAGSTGIVLIEVYDAD